jgi:hypothetical protein
MEHSCNNQPLESIGLEEAVAQLRGAQRSGRFQELSTALELALDSLVELQEINPMQASVTEAVRVAGEAAVVQALEQVMDDAEVVRLLRERGNSEAEPLANVALRLGIPFNPAV